MVTLRFLQNVKSYRNIKYTLRYSKIYSQRFAKYNIIIYKYLIYIYVYLRIYYANYRHKVY